MLTLFRRIQSCIIRFRSRRRLHEETARYFNEYLFLGGIDTNPNPFSGQDPGELKKLTPTERRDAVAHDGIHTHLDDEQSRNNRFYCGDLENWSVDFTGIVSGFFSMSVMPMTGLEPQALEKAVGVIDNFLRYALQHDVCPEYQDDVEKAIQVCDDALREWPMILKAQTAMPGQFNLACSRKFDAWVESDWYLADPFKTRINPNTVFLTSLALAEPKLFDKVSPKTEVIREFDTTIEIVNILRPGDDTVERFKSLKLDEELLGVVPIGKVQVKPASIEDEWEPSETGNLFTTGLMTLYFDDSILDNLRIGMKMSLRVCQLDINLKFVKTLYSLAPTFNTFLPQDLMRYFKPPRVNERPPPSSHDKAGGEPEDYDGEGGANAENQVDELDIERTEQEK